jgi:hypothetical protein
MWVTEGLLNQWKEVTPREVIEIAVKRKNARGFLDTSKLKTIKK